MDPRAPGRRGWCGRVPFERGGPTKQDQPRSDVPGRALLPDSRHRRERVPALAPWPVLLLLDHRVHHRVPGRWSRPRSAGRRRIRGRRGRPWCPRRRGRGRRGGLAPGPRASGAAPVGGLGRRVGIRVGLRRHARVHVHASAAAGLSGAP